MRKRNSSALSVLVTMALLLISPIQAAWAPLYLYLILLAGPLIFVPWGIRLFPSLEEVLPNWFTSGLIASQLFLLLAYCLSSGWLAALMSVPWLALTIMAGVRIVLRRQHFPLALTWAFVSLPVAAAWMLADRLGWQPLGFDPVIVLLTGIHFHYAGFALAVMTAFLPTSKWKKYVSIGLIPGVAGVASGITSTQLGGPAWIEIIGVSVMVIVGSGIAVLQIQSALRQKATLPSSLLLICGGIALLIGLSLALLYGWRFHYQWPWLTVPWMYATHGLLNSLGFATLSFLGATPKEQHENKV